MVDADLLSNTATSSNVSNLCFLCGLSFLPNASSTLLVSCPTRSIKRDTACGNCSNVMLSIYLCFVLLLECYLFGSLSKGCLVTCQDMVIVLEKHGNNKHI